MSSIDPSIALGIRPTQLASPVQTLGEVIAIKDMMSMMKKRQADMEEAQRKTERAKTVQEVASQAKTDQDLFTGLRSKGLLEEEIDARTKLGKLSDDEIKRQSDQIKTAKEKLQLVGQALMPIAQLPPELQSAAWDREQARLIAQGVLPKEYATTYTPEQLKFVTQQAMSVLEALDQDDKRHDNELAERNTRVQESNANVAQTRLTADLEGTIPTEDMREFRQSGGWEAYLKRNNIQPGMMSPPEEAAHRNKAFMEFIQNKGSASTKALQDTEVILQGGKRVMAFFNPDPANTGYFQKDPATGQLTDITSKVVGLYRPPSATMQILNSSQPTPNMQPDMSDALNRATMTLPSNQRAQVVSTVNQQVNRGNLNGAKDTIRQAALEGEDVATRNQVRGRREVVQALTSIEGLLKDLPTNLVSGTVEDVARRLGTSTDQRYVRVGQRLNTLLQSYRRSITGAAFSQAETSEYNTIFPAYTNTPPVNTTLINALREAFSDNDRIYWDYKLGPGWADTSYGNAPASRGGTNTDTGPNNNLDDEVLKAIEGL